MSLSNRCYVLPSSRRTTVAPGVLEGTQIGTSTGRSSFNNSRLIPNQPIIDLLDQAATVLPNNVYPQISPKGGDYNNSNKDNHASGWSTDVQLVRQGTVLTPVNEPDLYSDFISVLVGNSIINNRVCGIGLYNWGIHFDQLEVRQTGKGNVVSWNGWPVGVNSGPQNVLDSAISQGRSRAEKNQLIGESEVASDGTSGDFISDTAFPSLSNPFSATQQEIEFEKQSQSACDNNAIFLRDKNPGGTTISGAAVAATYSILQNQGLQVPPAIATVSASYESATVISLNKDIVDNYRSAPDYNSVASIQTISSVTEKILNMGSGKTLNALTGKMTGSVAGVIDGNLNNIITRPIQEVASNVLGNGDLAKFTTIFNNVLGATSAAVGLGRSLTQLQGQFFGNAREKIGNGSVTLPDNVAGFDLDKIAGGTYTDLVGPQDQILVDAVKDKSISLFGTAYRDMNAMVTQGFGSLTSDLTSLGRDLSSLGRLANFEDLLRIGTPGQIVEQLMIYGAAATHRVIVPILVENNESLSTINQLENDSLATEILSSITESELIVDAFEVLNITRNPYIILSLAELVNPDWIFATSRSSNRFTNLNEIALHLSILGESTIQDAQQLGSLILEMETISSDSNIQNEIQPVRIEENIALKDDVAPTSEYSGDNDLTVADFIGTAAGYRIVDSLPLIKQYLDELTADGTLDCYISLLELLKETYNGDYDYDGITPSSPGPGFEGTYLTESITQPNPVPLTFCGRYSFGYYTTQDEALLAIVDAVESELDYIYNNSTGATLEKLKRLQALHDEINHQLYKEQKLRKKYGVDIGFSEVGVELYTADGSTNQFKITGNPDEVNDPKITVYVAGLKLSGGSFSYNSTTKVVTVSSTPTSGQSVEIIYNTGYFDVTGSVTDVWSFTSNLENYGLNTGFGREADFIQRLLTNDIHGTRIKAAMIQSRNKERAATYGLSTPDYNRALSVFNEENPNGVSTFVDVTGVWAQDPERASEVYLQNKADVDSRLEYTAYQIKLNKNRQQQNFDEIMTVVSRKLIFHSGGYIAISNQLAQFYNTYKDSFRNRKFSSSNVFKVKLNDTYPTTGFVIGPYKQIVSEILRTEAIEDFIFDAPLEDSTKQYLKSIDIDIRILTTMIQKIMLVNAANYLGLVEDDVRNIFKIPSAGKYLVRNIANQL